MQIFILSRTTFDEYADYFLTNVATLYTYLDNDKPTVLYFHGYGENVSSESVQTVVQAYLKRNDHNILAVDYSTVAKMFYLMVPINGISVGGAIAAALHKMIELGLDSEKLHMVGYSMGGQIAGSVGRQLNFQVPRITGLDPEGLILISLYSLYLSSTDARFVDIIHTDAGFYGSSAKNGTVDFFPNRGRRIQPGCSKNFKYFSREDFCSHSRSWKYYAESVNDESAFIGVRCPSKRRFLSGKCNNNAQIIMGYGTPSNVKGKVFLKTKAQSPFGLREKGAQVRPRN